MGEIDRQRISAVRTLEGLGYAYRDGEGWRPPQGATPWQEADALYWLLVGRVDHLARHHVYLDRAELRAIIKALEAYEVRRWLGGKKVGRKG
jgi:hypothetical protein